MAQQGTDVTDLITRLRQGDRAVLGQLFSMFSERLLLMVRLRIDCRLRARVTESDVLQESFLEATKRIAEFLEQSKTPFYLWVRFLTLQQLAIHRRRHLRVQSRTVDREADLEGLGLPGLEYLSAELAGHLSTPSTRAIRAEQVDRLRRALDSLEPIDREILTLRHFEQLGNAEIAQVLSLKESTASTRYARALVRLKDAFGAEVHE
jgi:RNA polymerase sigma-70 factor (ECF subfamily)